MNIEKIIKEKRGTIVDVRTPEEFRGGHVADSVNIPLQELANRMEEVKNLKAPIVLCCASGGRSGIAHQLLTKQSIDSCNAGSWMDVNYVQTKTN